MFIFSFVNQAILGLSGLFIKWLQIGMYFKEKIRGTH